MTMTITADTIRSAYAEYKAQKTAEQSVNPWDRVRSAYTEYKAQKVAALTKPKIDLAAIMKSAQAPAATNPVDALSKVFASRLAAAQSNKPEATQ
jgi:ABC-type transporter lipoprotein component MlaA